MYVRVIEQVANHVDGYFSMLVDEVGAHLVGSFYCVKTKRTVIMFIPCCVVTAVRSYFTTFTCQQLPFFDHQERFVVPRQIVYAGSCKVLHETVFWTHNAVCRELLFGGHNGIILPMSNWYVWCLLRIQRFPLLVVHSQPLAFLVHIVAPDVPCLNRPPHIEINNFRLGFATRPAPFARSRSFRRRHRSRWQRSSGRWCSNVVIRIIVVSRYVVRVGNFRVRNSRWCVVRGWTASRLAACKNSVETYNIHMIKQWNKHEEVKVFAWNIREKYTVLFLASLWLGS